LKRYTHILTIALEAVLVNKFRSILTALGIIFGVAAVIAMMAIGRGAKQEILDQMKVIGVNNIMITPIIDYTQKTTDEKNQGARKAKRFSPGLTLQDMESIQKIIPSVKLICPEITYKTRIIKGGKQSKADLTGVTSDFFEIFNLKLEKGGIFNKEQLKSASPVCIIGNSIKSKFFPCENPIGKSIKCDNVWLTVIGVIEPKFIVKNASSNFGINNYNQNIYIPIQTILSRFNDRSLKKTSPKMIFFRSSARSSVVILGNRSNNAINKQNENQLDKIVVQVDEGKNLAVTSKVLETLLKRRHQDIPDFKVQVPELLLKQEQRTKDVFNIVLGAIASISLIVGGIGIMNIMLASILERIREIGVRLAVGARKRDIVLQFLTESTLISISGGIIGILLGILLSKLIMQLTDILTVISLFSIVISFGVSAAVGILFGFMPARKAAQQDPYTSLRHD
jgi:putative ABC transport system permease protein